jgi:putative membrane protein
MLTQDDHKQIGEAITQAESRTTGEIFCVLAHEVSRYREVPLAWAALAALLLPPLIILPGLHHVFFTAMPDWSTDSPRAMESLAIRALTSWSLFQAVIFLVVTLLVSLPRVKRAMTPRFLKRHRVRQAARRHFVAAGGKLGHSQPHILIFASLWDRQVELVAHAAIHKAVGEGPWNAAVAAVGEGMKQRKAADGFIRAIAVCGAALAQHFPAQSHGKNVLADDILEI